jgi:ParB family chromosome partitioning protein
LTVGHAKCLIGVDNAEDIANLVITRMMNVRQLENMLKLKTQSLAQSTDGTKISVEVDHESIDIAKRVSKALKIEAKLKITKKGGVFTLICKSCEELEELVEKLTSIN